MGISTALRQQVKSSFVPFMEAKGFIPDTRKSPNFLIFRRTTPDEIHVCDIQWEKYGTPRFIMNVGKCSREDCAIQGHHPADIEVSDTGAYGRLQPRKGLSTRSWFRQDKPFLTRLFKKEKFYPPEKTVEELITLFSEVEAYWQAGIQGPH